MVLPYAVGVMHGNSSTMHGERINEGDEENEFVVYNDFEMSFSENKNEEFVAQCGVEYESESIGYIDSDKENEIEGFNVDEV